MAGETAAKIQPKIAASKNEIENRIGAISDTAIISIRAGRKHSKIAGRPAIFITEISNENAALDIMIKRATLRIEDEYCSKEGDKKLNNEGPKRTPERSIPINEGKRSF